MAATVSSGADRFGQCPVAFSWTSRLPPRGQVGAVVRQEGGPGEPFLDLRVGPAEAGREFRAELGPVGVGHDDRGHGAGPAQVVLVQRGQQAFYVAGAEAAGVAVVIEVAR